MTMVKTTAGPQPLEVRIEGLKKAFGDHVVLNGIDMDIRQGEVVAIVGGSGCISDLYGSLSVILGIRHGLEQATPSDAIN